MDKYFYKEKEYETQEEIFLKNKNLKAIVTPVNIGNLSEGNKYVYEDIPEVDLKIEQLKDEIVEIQAGIEQIGILKQYEPYKAIYEDLIDKLEIKQSELEKLEKSK